jgi:O-antigen ligase
MWVLPFLSFRHGPPIPSFYGELTAAALGVVALGVLLRKEGWQPFALPAIALLPIGLVGLILLQFPFGKIEFSQQALLGMLYLLWAMMLMVLGSRLRQALGWTCFAVTLSWFVLAGGVLSALITLLQSAGWQAWMILPKKVAQGYGNLGQPNHFADYTALALASLLYLRAKGRIGRPVLIVVSLLFLAMLAFSGSRSSWLYLAAIVILSWMLQRQGGQRGPLLACLWLIPAFLVVQQIMPWLMDAGAMGAVATPTERMFREVSGVAVRVQIWQQAWQMFLHAPWLGVGFGQFDWNTFAMVDFKPAGGFVEPSEHAHNIILHLMAELGVFAGLLFIGALTLWMLRSLRIQWTLEIWWMCALLAIIGIHSLLEYPLWYTYFLGVAAVLLGAGETRMLSLALGRVGRPALASMLLLGSVGLFNLAQAYGSLETWMVRGLQGQVKDADLPAISRDLLKVHNESLLSPYVELVLATSIEPTPSLLDEKLQLNDAAMHFSPIRYIVFRQARLLALKGERAAALLQLHRAMLAYPQDVADFRRELLRQRAEFPGTFDFLLDALSSATKE